MSGVCRRRRRLFGVLAWALLTVTVSAPARADTVTVHVDQAHLLKLPDRVATIIIGNPLIADATLQSGGILVVTGKGYGATNLMALDRNGRVIMSKFVQVLGPSGDELVVVYRGVERETYSCAPQCQPRITLGDSSVYFNATLAETGARNGQAQGGNGGGAAAPAAPAPR
jgi:Pilus formation protein N terminal region